MKYNQIIIKVNALDKNNMIICSVDNKINLNEVGISEYIVDDQLIKENIIKDEKKYLKNLEKNFRELIPPLDRLVFCGIELGVRDE